MRSRKLAFARAVVVTAAIGVFGSLAFTGTSMAAAPGGVACKGDVALNDAANGRVSGRGATFQNAAIRNLIDGYRVDVCGSQPADACFSTFMITYNYPETGRTCSSSAGTGSGEGVESMGCRTDAFAGTDIPYTQASLALMNARDCAGVTTGGSVSSPPGVAPFAPPFPDPADSTTARVMSFPIAASSVAVPINLPAASCGGTAPGVLQLTRAEISGLFGGEYLTWNDPDLVANHANLANCAIPVIRVVRFDKSGTTQVFKNYLRNIDTNRTGATCDPTTVWQNELDPPGTLPEQLVRDARNQSWPGAPQGVAPAPIRPDVPASGTCAGLQTAGANGGAALITKLNATPGGIGYADLADAATLPAGVTNSQIRNGADTAFAGPASGLAANCNVTTQLPGLSASDAVGLNTAGDNWGTDSTANHSDITNPTGGTAYPICGLTFSMVYTGNSASGPGAGPVQRLTNNQRRTVYTFFQYAVSPVAQARLTSIRYQALPTGPNFLGRVLTGFRANY